MREIWKGSWNDFWEEEKNLKKAPGERERTRVRAEGEEREHVSKGKECEVKSIQSKNGKREERGRLPLSRYICISLPMCRVCGITSLYECDLRCFWYSGCGVSPLSSVCVSLSFSFKSSPFHLSLNWQRWWEEGELAIVSLFSHFQREREILIIRAGERTETGYIRWHTSHTNCRPCHVCVLVCFQWHEFLEENENTRVIMKPAREVCEW